MNIKTARIGGSYVRVADPDWPDPLDASFAAVAPGGRWNPPGLACLYLSADLVTARANVGRLFEGQPYGPEDLDPLTAPILVEVAVPDGTAADAFTDDGLRELGLPTSFPHDSRGDLIPHAACQPIGRAVVMAGLDGVDCRSAAHSDGREFAWFPRDAPAREVSRRPFAHWW